MNEWTFFKITHDCHEIVDQGFTRSDISPLLGFLGFRLKPQQPRWFLGFLDLGLEVPELPGRTLRPAPCFRLTAQGVESITKIQPPPEPLTVAWARSGALAFGSVDVERPKRSQKLDRWLGGVILVWSGYVCVCVSHSVLKNFSTRRGHAAITQTHANEAIPDSGSQVRSTWCTC